MQPHPKVSLIISTRNRASRLSEFLTRVAQLEPPPGGWELILLDNASTDSTRVILDEFARAGTIPVRCLPAPVPGKSRALNVGIAESSGDLLAFTDDDCYPSRDYLRTLVEIFDEHKPGFVGGRVVLHDPTDAHTLSSVTTPSEIRPRTFLAAGRIHGANMAVSREVVRTIGGFDPHLGAGTQCVGGEDIEYVARAVWAGWSGRYDPRLVVAHHHGRKRGPDAVRQSWGYDYGRGAYYVKFLLRPDARRTYVREWCRRVWWQLKAAMFGRPWRELMGGLRYLTERLLRPEPVPRFDGAHVSSHLQHSSKAESTP